MQFRQSQKFGNFHVLAGPSVRRLPRPEIMVNPPLALQNVRIPPSLMPLRLPNCSGQQWFDVRHATCRLSSRADHRRAHGESTTRGCVGAAKVPLVTWNTAAPRQPILLSRDESIFLQFTAVLSRHCAQISSHSLTEVQALAINLGSRPSRVFTKMPAKHPGTSLSLTCSRHCTYPPVPSSLVQVHCSPSGGA